MCNVYTAAELDVYACAYRQVHLQQLTQALPSLVPGANVMSVIQLALSLSSAPLISAPALLQPLLLQQQLQLQQLTQLYEQKVLVLRSSLTNPLTIQQQLLAQLTQHTIGQQLQSTNATPQPPGLDSAVLGVWPQVSGTVNGVTPAQHTHYKTEETHTTQGLTDLLKQHHTNSE